MSGLRIDPESGVIHLTPDSLVDEHIGVTTTKLADWMAGRDEVAIEISEVKYFDWILFERLLEVIRNFPGKARVIGASPALRSLFLLNHLDFLLA